MEKLIKIEWEMSELRRIRSHDDFDRPIRRSNWRPRRQRRAPAEQSSSGNVSLVERHFPHIRVIEKSLQYVAWHVKWC